MHLVNMRIMQVFLLMLYVLIQEVEFQNLIWIQLLFLHQRMGKKLRLHVLTQQEIHNH